MNKKLLFTDILIFLAGVVVLIITRLLTNLKVALPENYAVSVIYAAVLIGIIIFSTLNSYKGKDAKVNFFNVILPLMLSAAFMAIYFLPVFSFAGCLGVNNSVFMCFAFLLGLRYLYNLFLFIKTKVKGKNASINIPDNSLNAGADVFSKTHRLFIYMPYTIIFLCSVFILINTFLPVIDISLPFQDLFQ